MSMVKIIRPGGWDWDRPVAQMVKMSSQGLTGQDRRDFIKTASHVFVDVLDGIKLAKDDVPIHIVALGASEAYGPNRNGDAFSEATCRAHHKTFEKFARWYRSHKNKNPKESYGYVKHAAYNEAMRRVELLGILNGSKEAAERNGGLVADEELKKLANGEEIADSMACKVPFDICSGCHNKARTRAEYCTAQTCKRGGCRDNLTKMGSDGHILHVDNPSPTWFDISNVFRPADRIAYAHGADYLDKAAGDLFLPGAMAAEMLEVSAPLHVILASDDPVHWSDKIHGQYKLAAGLAILENTDRLRPATLRGLDPQVSATITDEQCNLLGTPGTEKAAAALGEMSQRKMILPLRDFARWAGKSAAADAAQYMLAGVYGRLAGDGNLEGRLLTNRWATSEKTASAVQRALISNLAPQYSLDLACVAERAMLSSLRMLPEANLKTGFWNEKQAADNPDAAALAEEYALYKLAALHGIASRDRDFTLTARLAVGQNRII